MIANDRRKCWEGRVENVYTELKSFLELFIYVHVHIFNSKNKPLLSPRCTCAHMHV